MEFQSMEPEFQSVNCKNFRSLYYGIDILFCGIRKSNKRNLNSGNGMVDSIIKSKKPEIYFIMETEIKFSFQIKLK
jgi:hypothetical protein